MKTIKDCLQPTNERWMDSDFNLQNPTHRRLYVSFRNWYKDMMKQTHADPYLIISMLQSAEEDIRYGEFD